MKTLTYSIENKEQTDIVIGKNLLSQTYSLLQPYAYTKIAILVDEVTKKLFLPLVVSSLDQKDIPYEIITIPAGEKSKSFATLESIVSHMYDRHLDRKSALIALGGGVVGDIATLAAALYYRGIDCIQIPTTLLSQVDSALGGKGAVDLGMHKNTIGIIRQPRLVIVDTQTLNSLPINQFRSGMGEVIKYAIAMDKDLFTFLEKGIDPKNLDKVVEKCVALKMAIVEKDPQDKTTQRAVVNFGHTLGQAIELQTNLLHGEAIAIGMVFAIKLSQKINMLSEMDAEKSLALLKQYELPTSITGVTIEKTIQQMKKDKKSSGGQIKFILLKGLGKPKANCTVEESVIKEILSEILL